MEFIKTNKKYIVLAVTFLAGGFTAIGFNIPPALVSLVVSTVLGVN